MSALDSKIAVIMRSYNDIDVIEGTLNMLSRQSIKDFELWNFDSTSTDGTLEVIRRYNEDARIRLNDSSKYNPGRILNEAVWTIEADILVFLNSDAEPQDEYWLERLIEPLSDGKVGAVFGRQVARPDCRSLFVMDTERAFGDGKESARWLHFFSMANSAARSSILRCLPFETAVQYSEDIEWSYRLRRSGYQIRYVADAVVMHSHNYTLRESYKRHFGEGAAEAYIFREGEISNSFLRYFLMPFSMAVLRDFRWAIAQRSLNAAIHSVPLRFCQKWSRWRGVKAGCKRLLNSATSSRSCPIIFTNDGNEKAEARIAGDQVLVSEYVTGVVPKKHFEALVLMGGYGRGEGGYYLINGEASPYNDYDYFVIVKNMSRKAASALQKTLKTLAHRLSKIVGIEIDLAVLRSESLASAPRTLMNAEMKWGHHVLAGNPDALDPMPGEPFDKLALGEFTRLMNNRGALLLMNARRLEAGVELSGYDRGEFFKFLLKAVLACGDAFLAIEGVYHPLYAEKQARLMMLKNFPGVDFINLYKLAVDQKFHPDARSFRDEDPEAWQRQIIDCWLDAFSKLETCRTGCQIRSWRDYAQLVVPKGQLEASQNLKNFAITLRDFGTRHTLRYLRWAWRYPRDRVISVLPLLLNSASEFSSSDVAVPLAIPAGSDWSFIVERYLKIWERYA